MKNLSRFLLLITLLVLTFPALGQDATPTPDDDFGLRPLQWRGEGRLTVLILGIDRRPDEGASRSVRTDLVILASIDADTQRIGLLHIPRDLFMMPLNSESYERVNTLFQDGEAIQPGYGAYWVADTLQANLGMYIDRYIVFDFVAFETLIDAMGGITLTTDVTISDGQYPDMAYDYESFYLPAGTHTLDGRQALQYTRTRHQDDDYQRGERQMQVIQAVQERLTEPDTFVSLLGNAPALMDTLDNHIYSDIGLEDAIYLARYVVLIPPENIVTGAINRDYIISTIAPNGLRVSAPSPTLILELMASVFGDNYNVQP